MTATNLSHNRTVPVKMLAKHLLPMGALVIWDWHDIC